jgi:DNA-directed RNA polymerase specialized sigma24 family protein
MSAPYGGALALVEPSLRELYVPLREQAMARVDVALRVAVLVRAGFPRQEIADKLGVKTGEVRRAIDELRAISDSIELGDRPGLEE